MDQRHESRVLARWSPSGTGTASSDSASNAILFTTPATFGGFEGKWTPEDLLLSSLASCFTTTCCALAKQYDVEYMDLEVAVGATVSQLGADCAFTEIAIRAKLTVSRREDQEQALRLLQKAKAVCLISRALAIPQTLETVVTVTGASSSSGDFSSKRHFDEQLSKATSSLHP